MVILYCDRNELVQQKLLGQIGNLLAGAGGQTPRPTQGLTQLNHLSGDQTISNICRLLDGAFRIQPGVGAKFTMVVDCLVLSWGECSCW